MNKSNRDHGPRVSRRESPYNDERQAQRGRPGSWLRSIVIIMALSACGVAGYFLADGVHLASQQAGPVAPSEPEPVAAADDATVPETQPPAPTVGPTTRLVGQWTLICPGSNVPRTDCALVQRLVDAEDRPLLVWSVTRDSDGTVRAMWQTQTNVDRQRGLVLDAGDGKLRTVPFAACAEQYCLARGILAPAYVSTLAVANRVSVAVSDPSGLPTNYTIAPNGLADGLAWLAGKQ